MAHERFSLDVTLGTAEDTEQNVIVLTGVDLVVPLEADLDGDPVHDHAARLESVDGSFWILEADDPDVRLDLDARRYLYRFRAVPCGLYSISVKGAAGWVPVVTGILVDKKGASMGGKLLAEKAHPPRPPPPPPPEEPAPEPEPLPEDFGSIIDDDKVL